MVTLPGLNRKSYRTRVRRGGLVPEVPCPSCQRLLSGHGWYMRWLDGERFEVRRLRCRYCAVTHALLPEDVCAYQDLTLDALEQAMATEGPTAGARAAGCEGAVRRVRRWFRSGVWEQLVCLLPVAGDLWVRIRTVVGPEPGMLVRLRHWLWTRVGYLFGGPCGLFRHGRPPAYPRGVST